MFALWLALLVQSMFEYPYAYAYFLLPAALLAGAVTRLPTQPAPDLRAAYVPGRFALVVAGLCAEDSRSADKTPRLGALIAVSRRGSRFRCRCAAALAATT